MRIALASGNIGAFELAESVTPPKGSSMLEMEASFLRHAVSARLFRSVSSRELAPPESSL